MKRILTSGIWLLGLSLCAQQRDLSKIVPPLEESGFQSMFDGKTLTGWDCDTDFWRVEDGAIVGESKLDHQPPQNIFCICIIRVFDKFKYGSVGIFNDSLAYCEDMIGGRFNIIVT